MTKKKRRLKNQRRIGEIEVSNLEIHRSIFLSNDEPIYRINARLFIELKHRLFIKSV